MTQLEQDKPTLKKGTEKQANSPSDSLDNAQELDATAQGDSSQQTSTISPSSQAALKKHGKQPSQARQDKRSASETDRSNAERDDAAADKSVPKSASQTVTKPSRWRSFALLLLFVVSFLLLLFGMQNNQSINELRNDLNQVQTKQTRILDQQDQLLAQSGSALSEENATQIERLTQRIQDQQSQQTLNASVPPASQDIEALQQQQQALESRVAEQIEQAFDRLQTLQTPVKTSEGQVDLAPILRKISTLEQALQTMQSAQQSTKVSSVAVAEPVEAVEAPLMSLQKLQQWILENNTQWLLGASVKATIDRLNAIEQAAQNAGYPQITALARLVGEDIAALKKWADIAQQPLPSVVELKAAVNALAPPKLALQQAEKLPQAEVLDTTTEALQVGEVAEQESAWQRLLARLSEMVTIKNRQSTGEPTTVEALLQHDVQKQRLLLLIERMQWSAERESQQRFELAVLEVQQFVNQYFADHSKRFEVLLKPFRQFVRQQRQPLATAGFHVKPASQ